MARKRKGVVARPGKIDNETITKEELLRAAQYQGRIPLIVGPHPLKGIASPDDWIGSVGNLSWNDDENQLEGEFWFYDEEWHRVPADTQTKIINEEFVNLSAGYQIGESKGAYQGRRKWDHLTVDIQNPKVEGVGFDVRMETQLPENFRIEQEASLTASESEPEATTEVKAVPIEEAAFSAKQLSQLRVIFAEMSSAPPAEAVSPEEPIATPEPEIKKTEPDPVPEKVMPASAPSKSQSDKFDEKDALWEL